MPAVVVPFHVEHEEVAPDVIMEVGERGPQVSVGEDGYGQGAIQDNMRA